VTTADLLGSLFPIGVIVFLVVPFFIFGAVTDSWLGGALGAIPGVGAILFIRRRFIAGKRLIVNRIHKGTITLKGVADVAARAMTF
jgi:hypothetical protein